MPEVDIRRAEKLAEINLGEPASEPRKTLRELLGDGEWDSYKMFPDGSVVDAGKSKVEWLDDSTPRWHPVDMDKVDEMIKAWKGRVEEATHTENWELWGASVIDSPEVRQAQVDLNAVCRDTIQDLIEEKRTTQVGGTHYEEMNIQPWTAMKAWMSPEEYTGYHVGTVIGYLSRHKKKGSEQDIRKAKHHLEELVRYFEEEEEYPW